MATYQLNHTLLRDREQIKKVEVGYAWERQAAPRERDDSFLWAISSSERDSGWTIEVAVGDYTTDKHMGCDDSEISPGDGA